MKKVFEAIVATMDTITSAAQMLLVVGLLVVLAYVVWNPKGTGVYCAKFKIVYDSVLIQKSRYYFDH